MKRFYREHILLFVLMIAICSPETKAQVDVILQLTNPLCGGFSTGSIYAIPISGLSPYTYEWSNNSTDNPINNLPVGTYSVTVTDANGETGSAEGTLMAPPMLDVIIKVIECGVPGTMEAVITGGTEPLEIIWDNGETTPIITDLQAGQYCITVTDDNSCAFQTCESTGPEMTVTVETDSAFCGTGMGGNVYAITTGGVSPYNYEWNTGQTVDTLLDIPPGEYSVTVVAENGCIEIDTGKVELGPGRFDINFDIIHPGCMGNSSGSITAIPSGGIAPYDYLWDNGDTVNNLDNLPVGTYYITVTDSIGCTVFDSVDVVLANVIETTFDRMPPSCFGFSDGTATAIVQSGNPPYGYLWSNGDTTAHITGLSAGTYTVFITDSLNCLGLDSVILADPPILELEVTSTDLTDCGADDGMAIGTAVGGILPYSFLWSNEAVTDTISDLPPGTYYLTVSDANGCQVVDSTSITGPEDLIVEASGTGLICWKESTAILETDVINGSPPFEYNWSSGDTTRAISSVPAGWYYVTVTSTDGCIGIDSIEVESNPEITITETITHASCSGFNDGAISVSVGGGTSPLDILWENGSNSTIRNGLGAGEYSISVSDAVGCASLDTFQVAQSDELLLSFNSSAGSCGSNGFTIAIVVGGTSPYHYLWETGDTTSFIDELASGNYDLTVTDSKGCSQTGTANIPAYPAIDLTVDGTNTTCNGNSNGTASASATGGVAPLAYLWNTGETTMQIVDLPPGFYTVTITDAEDCTQIDSVEVELGDGLDVTIDGEKYICEGQTGTLTASALGGTSFYNYLWSNGATTQTITNLAPNWYSVTVSDPFGCTGEISKTLLEGGDYTIISEIINVDCHGESTGQIELNVFNAQPVVKYEWNTTETTPVIENLPAGNYSVTVSDFTGCTKQIGFALTESPLLELSLNGIDGTCGNLGSVHSTVTGGTPPYNYEWDNGSPDTTISILGAGTYVLTVTDAKGCKAVDSSTIDVTPSVSCNIMLMQPITSINGSEGELFSLVDFGTPPYEFEWSNGQMTDTISDLFFGNYTVTVMDADDCMTTCNFFLLNGARIGNLVWYDANENGIQNVGETGIEAITIELEGMDSYGNMVNEFTTTNVQGLYRFDVIPGNYQLTFDQPTGFLTSPSQQGGDLTTDSDINPSTNQTSMFPVASGQNEQHIDAGFFIEITCDNITDAGTLCCGQNLCAPGEQPTIITSSADAMGGTGTLEYAWMYSELPGPFDPSTWTLLANSNAPEYIPAPLNVTTHFIRLGRRSGCTDFVESNIIEITVNDFVLPEITGSDTVCADVPVSFMSNDFGANATYLWDFENGIPNTADSLLAENIIWEEPGDQTVSLTIDINGCTLTADYSFLVTNNPLICGFYPLVLEGEMNADMQVVLDWRYPPGTPSLLRTYLVERADESDNFTSLGPPDFSETVGDLSRYFRIDSMPQIGINRYRVVLNDSEGNVLISNVVQFEKDSIPSDRPSLVHIYPNPFGDKITVEINDRFEDVPITIETFNALGQLVTYIELPADEDIYEIDSRDWAAGTYFFFVKYGGQPQKVFKMVK